MGSWRLLAEAPPVPGLTLRGFRGAEDFPAMSRVLNAACAADGVERFESADEMARNYAHLVNSDPATDLILADLAGETVAYGRVEWWQEYAGPYRYMAFCFVDPKARGRGLGRAMLTHNEARLRQIASDHPEDAEKWFMVFCAETEKAAAALFDEFGYEAYLFDAEMVRPHLGDIPDLPLPDGLQIRTPSADEMRAVWEADAEAFQDHVGASPPTEADYQRFLSFPWSEPALWRVAWDGDTVAGQVRSYIDEDENAAFDRKRGYTEFISVRRPYRRRGLARALLTRSLLALRDAGMEEAALGVLTSNPHGAYSLYESVGFRVVQRSATLRKRLAQG